MKVPAKTVQEKNRSTKIEPAKPTTATHKNPIKKLNAKSIANFSIESP